MEFFSPWHIFLVVIVGAALYFGGDKLPDFARSVGSSLRVFKNEIKGLTGDDDAAGDAHGTDARDAGARDESAPVEIRKAIEAPAADQTPRVVATPREPIAVQAEVVRPANAGQQQGARPRPRPAGSGARK